MLRRGLQLATGIRNSDLKLLRTEEGRPYVEGLKNMDVNVSHHGDFVGKPFDNRNMKASKVHGVGGLLGVARFRIYMVFCFFC